MRQVPHKHDWFPGRFDQGAGCVRIVHGGQSFRLVNPTRR